jgi:hypothetical protein
MVFNATFNNIAIMSWRPVSLVEETTVAFVALLDVARVGPGYYGILVVETHLFNPYFT